MVGKFETRKDTVQELTESLASHVGSIANIVSGAVRDVTREIGDWATDMFEMREAAAKARAADEADAVRGLDDADLDGDLPGGRADRPATLD